LGNITPLCQKNQKQKNNLATLPYKNNDWTFSLTSRAVFPYTIVVLCWHGLANRVGMIFVASDSDSEAGQKA
jgi:hypothetical protein